MARSLQKTKKAEFLTLEEAVKKYMHDGIVCAFSGFTGFNRNPVAFAWETVRQGIKDIHVLDRHGSICTWLLNAVNAIKIYETDWMGWGEMAGKIDVNLDRNYKAGKMILEDYAHGAMAMRFLAGAVGAPFIPYHAPLGSDLYNPEYDALGRAGLRNDSNPRIPKKKFIQMEDPFYGDGDVVLLPAARPELAIIHVSQAGDKGTARWRGVGTIDKEIAFACDKVVLICEEIVPEAELRVHPESNQIPYFTVDCIVEQPWGAYPSSVPFYYDYDAPFMRTMDAASRNPDDLKKWLDEWVYEPKSWEDFMTKLGAKKLLDLRADSVTGYSTRIMRGKKPAPRMKMPLSVERSGY
ncbi:CoA transferase subunit A [Desulforhabdus amnigena]|jgi:glutaconate CoA-transferase subunit A|uniref:CoA-transferase n=1 Tax=Desulforhabdus amnigena TaxID=40218 RepID=A0A9W6FTI0_9BACT|nr:CoA-transferase [Desulforhabdus amnigena]NLJ26690.1 acyl CoA--acetate/3-ketoacid CoA transferase subunit alpha [Deltaproteobacteria bacterium]GLI33950.1 CoA-transferase [Desulforhabdus amnigena]